MLRRGIVNHGRVRKTYDASINASACHVCSNAFRASDLRTCARRLRRRGNPEAGFRRRRQRALSARQRRQALAFADGGNEPYRLDSGDKLRIVVFGQETLTNSYSVDGGGNIENWSVLFDLYILLRTPLSLLKHESAY